MGSLQHLMHSSDSFVLGSLSAFISITSEDDIKNKALCCFKVTWAGWFIWVRKAINVSLGEDRKDFDSEGFQCHLWSFTQLKKLLRWHSVHSSKFYQERRVHVVWFKYYSVFWVVKNRSNVKQFIWFNLRVKPLLCHFILDNRGFEQGETKSGRRLLSTWYVILGNISHLYLSSA